MAKYGLHVIQYPSGRFGYVGTVPVDIAYIDPTPELLERARFGARFGPKQRTFDSLLGAITFAQEHGHEVLNR